MKLKYGIMLRKIIILILIIPFGLTSQIKPDKYYHASAGALISVGTYSIGQYSKRDMNPIAPTLIAGTIGFSKEIYDGFAKDNFSGKDLLWTAASAAVVNVTLRLIWKKKRKHKKKPIEFDVFDQLGLIEK